MWSDNIITIKRRCRRESRLSGSTRGQFFIIFAVFNSRRPNRRMPNRICFKYLSVVRSKLSNPPGRRIIVIRLLLYYYTPNAVHTISVQYYIHTIVMIMFYEGFSRRSSIRRQLILYQRYSLLLYCLDIVCVCNSLWDLN